MRNCFNCGRLVGYIRAMGRDPSVTCRRPGPDGTEVLDDKGAAEDILD